MKSAIILAAVLAAVAHAKPSGDGHKGDDHEGLKHAGAPVGESTWDPAEAAFFAEHTEFAAWSQDDAHNTQIVLAADGSFTYPEEPELDGKYLGFACVDKEKHPGLYWAKLEGNDGEVVAETGTLWELEDGTYAWSWADTTGAVGINTAAKAESHCGWKKDEHAAATTTEAVSETATETATTEAVVATTETAAETTTDAVVETTTMDMVEATTDAAETTTA